MGNAERKNPSIEDEETPIPYQQAKYLMKIGLTGTGFSGKTTFGQHLALLHGQGLTGEEIQNFKGNIFNSILSSFKKFLGKAEEWGIDIPCYNAAQAILKVDLHSADLPTIADHIKTLWKTTGTRFKLI